MADALTVIARPGKIVTDTVSITMHAVVTETHDLSNTVTDHPVEEGANISDHSRPDPDRVTFDARISNTPLSTKQQTQAVKSGGFTFQSAAAQAAGAIGATDGFAQGEWRKLKKLRDDGTLVKVVSTMGDYDSMAIVSISLPRTAKNYDAISFLIAFKHVRVVQNKLTRDVKTSVAPKKKSAGNKTPKAAEPEVEKSTLAGWADDGAKSGNKTISNLGKLVAHPPAGL